MYHIPTRKIVIARIPTYTIHASTLVVCEIFFRMCPDSPSECASFPSVRDVRCRRFAGDCDCLRCKSLENVSREGRALDVSKRKQELSDVARCELRSDHLCPLGEDLRQGSVHQGCRVPSGRIRKLARVRGALAGAFCLEKFCFEKK